MSKHPKSTNNSCLLCKSIDVTEIGSHSEGYFNTNIFYCYRCEFGYCYPMPTNDNLEEFYAHEYSAHRFRDGDRGRNRRKRKGAETRALSQHSYIQDYLEHSTKKMSILDVGCNFGALLEAFRNSGFNVTGCEADARAINRAQPIIRDKIFNEFNYYKIADSNSKKYDVITFSHVLEHFNNVVTLTHYEKLLTKGGLLFIEVPNEPKLHLDYRIKSRRWGHHLLFFSEKSLRILCEKLGLELIEDSIMTYGKKRGLDEFLRWSELRDPERFRNHTNTGTAIRVIYRKN